MAFESTEIPEDWTTLHWKQQAILAQALYDDAKSAAEETGAEFKEMEGPMTGARARAIINGEINRRAKSQALNERSTLQPDIPEDVQTMPIKILRDTWLGDERVRAEGQIVNWPLDDAKRLIKARVAERADPLPG